VCWRGGDCLAGQMFAACRGDGGAQEKGEIMSGHYRQVFVDIAECWRIGHMIRPY